jgi:hypothetical protein
MRILPEVIAAAAIGGPKVVIYCVSGINGLDKRHTAWRRPYDSINCSRPKGINIQENLVGPGMTKNFDDYAPYRAFIDSGQFSHCIASALDLLELAKELAEPQFRAAHKGTPFYVLGFAAFASHDFSTASLFFDAAVEEDLTNYPNRSDSPALLFMQLDPTSNPTLAQEIIAVVNEDLTTLIRDYNGRTDAQPLTVNDLRTIFLRPIIHSPHRQQRALATALISFVAEWRYRRRLIALIEHGSREPFFLHLFRGCLLFESLLKAQTKKVPTKSTLGEIFRHDVRAELALTKPDVRETDFNTIVAGLSANMGMEETINSVGKARNTLGHNIVWATANLNTTTYDMLVKNIAAACLHVVSKLYG